MTSYTLVVSIDQETAAALEKDNYQLCLSVGVATRENVEPDYTLLTYSTGISTRKPITWTEEYGIATSDHPIGKGTHPFPKTEVVPVKLGQTYTKTEDSSNGTADYDGGAPPNGILINCRTKEVPVLYKKFDDAFAPIYASPDGPSSLSSMTLIPTLSLKVFFRSERNSQTMHSVNTSIPHVFDLANHPGNEMEVLFNGKDQWSVVPKH